MRRLVAPLAVLIAAACFGVVFGLVAVLAGELPAPMCPPTTATMGELLDNDDPGRLLVCLYDIHGRLMNEHHILRQMPPVFPTATLPPPFAEQV